MLVLKQISGLSVVASVVLLAACSSGGGGSSETLTAKDQRITLLEDVATSTTLEVSGAGGGALTYRIKSYPDNGVLVGSAPNYQYVPAANFFGEDSFTFVANNGQGDSNTATVSLTIQPVNDAPVAEDKTVSTNKNKSVWIAVPGTDAENDALTYRIATQPVHGGLSQNTNSSVSNFEYTPSVDFFGTDSFTFIVNDGVQDSAEGTIYIIVRYVNAKPEATPEKLSLEEDGFKDIVLKGEDADGEVLVFSLVSEPYGGTLTGTVPNLRYTPDADFNGTDVFSFRVHDGTEYSSSGRITLNVSGVNDAPVAENLAVRLYQDNVSAITLLGSDIDIDPDLDPPSTVPGAIKITYRVDTDPAKGVLSGTAPELVYTPNPGSSGVDSFSYVAIDDISTESAPATVSLAVIPTANLPIKLNDTGITFKGKALPLGGNDPVCGASEGQDCNSGHDYLNNDNADGHAGFQFTKVSADGTDLSVGAVDWRCVRDNVTGLIWEVKTAGNGFVGDGGLYDVDDRYTWYSDDVIANGGTVGYEDGAGSVCYGYDVDDPLTYCNTQAYVDRVNAGAGLCGANDWRVPTLLELESIIDFSRDSTVTDLTYFPNTRNGVYWSSSAYAASEEHAWNIDFTNGRSAYSPRSDDYALRLVRTAP